MVPKRALWEVDRHTLNMLVQNKIVTDLLPSTKSRDLYYRLVEGVIGSAFSSCHQGYVCGSVGQRLD